MRAMQSHGDLEYEAEEKDEGDLGWLDFILPAVDEVNMLVRVLPSEMVGLSSAGDGDIAEESNSKLVEMEVPEVMSAEPAKDTPGTRASHDDKVHEKMMMVSDW